MGHESIQTTYEYIVLVPEEQKAEELKVIESPRTDPNTNESSDVGSKSIREELFKRYRSGNLSIEEWIEARKLLE